MARLSLSQNEFRILAALYNGNSNHGYGLLKIINEEESSVNTNILIGSLYNTLTTMEQKKGYIESTWADPDDPATGPRRRHYKITDKGKAIYQEAEANLFAIWSRTGRDPVNDNTKLKTKPNYHEQTTEKTISYSGNAG